MSRRNKTRCNNIRESQGDKNTLENNSVFVIMPFSLQSPRKTHKFVEHLISAGCWEESEIKTKFLYKYVTRKLFSKTQRDRKCYILKYKGRRNIKNGDQEFDINGEKVICPSNTLGGLGCETYHFVIDEIKLILFSSNICMVAFRIHFLCNTPEYEKISNSLYFIKKTFDTRFRSLNSNTNGITWLTLAKAILDASHTYKNNDLIFDFNYYSEEKYSRANFFVSLSGKNIDDYERALYYLKFGFSNRYDYIELEDEANYYAANGRKWGITSEGCACILTVEEKSVLSKQFLEFQSEYFLIYCLLLHQKYYYYKLLMQLSAANDVTAHDLQHYKSDLIDFESDFVFSTVTEVPQYQGIYENLFSRLKLSNLYADVEEPINNLNNKIIERNEKAVRLIGYLASLFGLFSILADGYFVIDLLFNSSIALCFVEVTLAIVILVLVIVMVIKVIRQIRKK